MRIAAALLALFVSVAAWGMDLSNEITPDNVVRVMNAYRAERGLPPLKHDPTLDRAAQDRIRDMADGGWWSHASPDGISPFIWLPARDYYFSTAGENLAAGFETANLLVLSWMESPGHKANIVGDQFEDCGVAIIDGSTKGPAVGKSVVVLFAKRAASAAARR